MRERSIFMNKLVELIQDVALLWNKYSPMYLNGIKSTLVLALVATLIGCIIGLICGSSDFSSLKIGPVNIGNFINAVIDFLIIALVLFCVIKAFNKARDLATGPKQEAAPTTKICPFCKSEISIEATRCPHCTSELK